MQIFFSSLQVLHQLNSIEFPIQASILLLEPAVHPLGCAGAVLLTCSLPAVLSSRTACRWSTPASPSCVSEGTGSSWPRPAGTTACGSSGGGSCSRWRCSSTTRIWCRAWPSRTTGTPGSGCWRRAPGTSGSACGPSSARTRRPAEVLKEPTQSSRPSENCCRRTSGSSARGCEAS